MALSREEVLHIARLARLELSDADVERYKKQLSSILDYIEILHEVDTDNVLPTAQVTGLYDVLRSDDIEQKSSREELLSCSSFPKENHQIKVKAVFED